MKPLWPHQVEALALLRQSLGAGQKRPVLQLPTGAGKTVVAANIILSARERGNRITFCVPALSLIEQTIAAFWAEGIREIGVMQADHRMTSARRPVQVASVQTLARRKFPDADLVIVDECHRRFACVTKWIAEQPNLTFIGLSATPWSKGLGKDYDDLIVPTTTRDLIAKNRLCPFQVYAPAHPDLRGVKTVAGDYHEGQLAQAMNKTGLVSDIVTTWLEKARKEVMPVETAEKADARVAMTPPSYVAGAYRPTLVFAVDRAHAKHLQERFVAAGVPAAYQDMNTTDAERAEIKRGFHDAHYAVVCNVGTLTTGVDWDVRCVVLARPTKSEILFVQIIGRGLRLAAGKTDCLILDHSDNHLRLGFVTDIHHAELDDGKVKPKKRKLPLPKECPRCHFLRPPRVAVCPACGYVAVKPPKLQEAAGRLARLTPRQPTGSSLVRLGGVLLFKADLYAELLLHGERTGYKRGWAQRSYEEATGERAPLAPVVTAFTVSDPVQRWIKSRQIAFYRRKTG